MLVVLDKIVCLNLQGTIHPFRKTHRSVFGKLLQEFRLVSSDRRVSVCVGGMQCLLVMSLPVIIGSLSFVLWDVWRILTL